MQTKSRRAGPLGPVKSSSDWEKTPGKLQNSSTWFEGLVVKKCMKKFSQILDMSFFNLFGLFLRGGWVIFHLSNESNPLV